MNEMIRLAETAQFMSAARIGQSSLPPSEIFPGSEIHKTTTYPTFVVKQCHLLDTNNLTQKTMRAWLLCTPQNRLCINNSCVLLQ